MKKTSKRSHFESLFLFLVGNLLVTISFAANLRNFSQNAIENSNQLNIDEQDLKISQINAMAASHLFNSWLSIEPYSDSYFINGLDGSPYNDYKEIGTNLTYHQNTSFGTELEFGFNKIEKNERVSSLEKSSGFSWSLKQPLLNNSFGKSQTHLREYFANNHKLQKAKFKESVLNVCKSASATYIEYWKENEKFNFLTQLKDLSEQILKNSDLSFKRGQMSQLDWLGIQSEHLDLKLKIEQSNLALSKLLLEAKKFQDLSRQDPIDDPMLELVSLIDNLKQVQPKVSIQEEILQQNNLSLDSKIEHERYKALPKLDLIVTNNANEGRFDSEYYDDSNVIAKLNFTYYFDKNTKSAHQIARYEKEKNSLKLSEHLRLKLEQFNQSRSSLLNSNKILDIENEKLSIQTKITNEYRKRFLQGRVDFQDYLRVKEQLVNLKTLNLDSKSLFYKNIISFYADEQIGLPFCEVIVND